MYEVPGAAAILSFTSPLLATIHILSVSSRTPFFTFLFCHDHVSVFRRRRMRMLRKASGVNSPLAIVSYILDNLNQTNAKPAMS